MDEEPVRPATHPLVGRRLAHYEVLSLLGAGGMGEVFLAEDTRLDRKVALKVLPAAKVSEPARVARFEQEAKTVAALNHPNIVTLYSVEEFEGIRFLTMELVEGRTLEELLQPAGLPLRRFFALAVPYPSPT